MKKLSLLIILLSSFSLADTPALPRAIVTPSISGNTYFTMLPMHYYPDKKELKKSFGKAYKLKNNGESELLWEVSGWYAFRVYISSDGQYLVRTGSFLTEGHEPSEEDLAVAFYKHGKELKVYSTKDLVKNTKFVSRRMSRYIWLAQDGDYPQLGWGTTFKIKTIDGYIHSFNIETGDLIESTKP